MKLVDKAYHLILKEALKRRCTLRKIKKCSIMCISGINKMGRESGPFLWNEFSAWLFIATSNRKSRSVLVFSKAKNGNRDLLRARREANFLA